MTLIKRYGNRRLYDMDRSSYIKLDDVGDMVRRGDDFQVVDAKTGKDLTRRVLTQILVEDARQGSSGPPIEFLRHLILASDPEMQGFLNWYLAQALDAYKSMRSDWKNDLEKPQAQSSAGPTPTVPAPPKDPDASKGCEEPDAESGPLLEEMQELRRRMAEMEKFLTDKKAPPVGP